MWSPQWAGDQGPLVCTLDIRDNSGGRAAHTTLALPRNIPMHLFLIGYRATGKTTVAELLAARLGRVWVDSDDQIESQSGKTIAEIFAEDGEEAFRDLESAAVAELCGRRDDLVVALGGGAVLREGNRRLLDSTGKTVWLQAEAATILERIAADPTTTTRRPNLTLAGGLAEIEQLLSEREPIYRQSADLVVDTQGKDPAQVADEIVRRLQLSSQQPE